MNRSNRVQKRLGFNTRRATASSVVRKPLSLNLPNRVPTYSSAPSGNISSVANPMGSGIGLKAHSQAFVPGSSKASASQGDKVLPHSSHSLMTGIQAPSSLPVQTIQEKFVDFSFRVGVTWASNSTNTAASALYTFNSTSVTEGIPFTTAPFVYVLNNLIEGQVDTKRESDTVYWTKLLCEFWLYPEVFPGAATASIADIGDILIVYDKQPSAAIPSFATMVADMDYNGNLESHGSANVNPITFDIANWRSTRSRFILLLRWNPILPSYSVESVGPQVNQFMSPPYDSSNFHFSKAMTLPRLPTCFYDGQTYPYSGAIYLVSCGLRNSNGGWRYWPRIRLHFNEATQMF